MSRRSDREFLKDIREGINRIERYIAGMTYEDFVGDTKTQDAVLRNLEIVGEATKNISRSLKERYPSVPWKSMAKVRDRLIHHYFGVSLDIVWEIATKELGQVGTQLDRILEEEE